MIRRRDVAAGTMVGQWEITRIVRGPRGGIVHLEGRCSCGTALHSWKNLLSGKTARCEACHRAFRPQPRRAAFPDPKVRAYWKRRVGSIVGRCEPGSPSQASYANRGIGVCHEWRTNLLAFARYLAELPGADDRALQLDRIDNDRGYEPGNVRMATRSQNVRNGRAYRGGREPAVCDLCRAPFVKRAPGQRFCCLRCGTRGHGAGVRPKRRAR